MLNCCIRRSASIESLNAVIEGPPIYRCRANRVIREGYAFTVHGKIRPGGIGLIIDFNVSNVWKDIALRLIFRLSTNSLSRSSRLNFNWCPAETSLENPLNLVQLADFKVEVFFTTHNIYVAFDGVHVAKYEHRVDYTSIHNIEIRGHITDLRTEHSFTGGYPTRETISANVTHLCEYHARLPNTEETEELNVEEKPFLSLPFYAVFGKGFLKLNYSININGRVKDNARLIKVSLQDSQYIWPEPRIAMLIEFRFTEEPVIVFSSYLKRESVDGTTTAVSTELRPGGDFNLLIVLGRISYEINLNKQQVYEYPYLVVPRFMTTCCVQGDLQLVDVVVESDFYCV